MLNMPIEVGQKGRYQLVVQRLVTAAAVRDGLPEVFGTPFLVMIMENAAIDAIASNLAPGTGSVGTKINVTHSSATPIGMKVWAEAEITDVQGKRLTYSINAYDETGLIGSATHERVLIQSDNFWKCVQSKMN